MRRIFTFALTLATSFATISSAHAQTCTVGTTAPVGVTFNNPRNVNPGQGFTAANQTTFGVFPRDNTSAITSPIYFYNTAQSTIYFSYTLQSLNPSSIVNPGVITIEYGSPVQQIICFTNSFTVANAATTYYFSITPATPFPASTNFRIRLDLTIAQNQKDITAINFSSNAVPAPSNAVLPVRFAGLNASVQSNGNVGLVWNVDVEENVAGYQVERSADGVRYASIGYVSAAGQRSYSYTDAAPIANAYYRIKSVDVDGKFGYSTVVNVKGERASVVMKGFFNSGNTLIVQHDAAQLNARITVTTADGRVVRTVVPQAGSQQTSIALSEAATGMYIIRYEGQNGEVGVIKLVKQ